MSTASQVLLCLAVVALCGGLQRALPVPLPLVQIAAGALLAWPCGVELGLEPETFLLVFVAPLLFIDGFRIPKRTFKRFRNIIVLLAFGLVVLTVLGAGTVIWWCLPSVPAPLAFAIAAALSPTDAVALSGITGRTKVPPTLMHVLSGEALMNDASGLVCLRVAVAAIATGTFSWTRAAGSLGVVAIGGVVIGVLVTWLCARVVRLVLGDSDEDGGPRTLIVVLLPFGAYLAAESVHLSGILAAAASGMIFPAFGIVGVNHRIARRHIGSVLGMIEIALNGLVFVLLGLQLPRILREAGRTAVSAGLESAMPLVRAVVLCSLAMFVVRFVWVWVSMRVTVFRHRKRGEEASPLPRRVVFAIAFAGVRGAVSLAAALTIPLAVVDGAIVDYPARAMAVTVTAGVILISLAAASVGLPLLLRNVVLPEELSPLEGAGELRAALAEAARAAVEAARDARIAERPDDAELVNEAANVVLGRYLARGGDEGLARALVEERALRSIGIRAERDQLKTLWRTQHIDGELVRHLLQELDAADEFVSPPASRASHEAGSR